MKTETRFVPELQTVFDWHAYTLHTADLGPLVERSDIQSSIGPFLVLPEYRVSYPDSVVSALSNLYTEYNRAFHPLVQANREWGTDYQYCTTRDGVPVNGWVQIDMVGLSQGFLDIADSRPEEEVQAVLRNSIFEIENSLAMYQLLQEIFSTAEGNSTFKQRFRASLEHIRNKHGRPIALLAVTDQKYLAMKQTEFGVAPEDPLTDEEVERLSGFDRFFGPEDFRAYLESTGGECEYLLYVRSSDPIPKLKHPGVTVEHPLFGDPVLRKIIKAHALTFNVDAPDMPYHARINDTKEYMFAMGMAFQVEDQHDIITPEFVAHLATGRTYDDYDGTRVTPQFTGYLEQQGIEYFTTTTGELMLRAKPLKGTYGCYGHLSGELRDKKFRNELRGQLKSRGKYVLQNEMEVPMITDGESGRRYLYIDRLFFSTDGDEVKFMGGFRSLMPEDSAEAQGRRIHGNEVTTWAEIC